MKLLCLKKKLEDEAALSKKKLEDEAALSKKKTRRWSCSV